MKKILILPILLGLTACDRPNSQVELDCGRAYQDSETKIYAKTYNDKAVIKINGGKEIVLKVVEDEDGYFYDSVSRKRFEYEGFMPETNEKVNLDFRLNKADGIIEYYSVKFENSNSSWGCNVMNKFLGKYKKPSKEALCIEEINKNVFLESDEDVKPGEDKKLFITQNINEYVGTTSAVNFHEERFVIPQEEALSISENWDYKNMKLYSNKDEKIEEHEKDACEVAKRLKKYIRYKGLDKTKYIYKVNKNSFGKYSDYSFFKNKKIKTPKEIGDGYLDIISADCSNKDLSGYNVERISFDYGTEFPKKSSKLPAKFDSDLIMDKHRNPGLNVRKLHEMGIDGSGVSMAIIDTKLAPHWEYDNNLTWYEEVLFNGHNLTNTEGEMHGSAVSSIAVGRTVGVAPMAKLYYFAADLTDGVSTSDKKESDKVKLRTSKYYASALDAIIDINRNLSDDEKIVVVSISANPSWSRDPEIWSRALDRAKKAGIFVTTTAIDKEYGLFDNGVNRDLFGNIDEPESYSQTYWQEGYEVSEEQQKKTLCFPMDHRTTASPTGYDNYVHYADGGWSWMKPFEAGLYVLAKQVKRDITPEEFFKVGLETGTYTERAKCVLVNPVALIESLKNN